MTLLDKSVSPISNQVPSDSESGEILPWIGGATIK